MQRGAVPAEAPHRSLRLDATPDVKEATPQPQPIIRTKIAATQVTFPGGPSCSVTCRSVRATPMTRRSRRAGRGVSPQTTRTALATERVVLGMSGVPPAPCTHMCTHPMGTPGIYGTRDPRNHANSRVTRLVRKAHTGLGRPANREFSCAGDSAGGSTMRSRPSNRSHVAGPYR